MLFLLDDIASVHWRPLLVLLWRKTKTTKKIIELMNKAAYIYSRPQFALIHSATRPHNSISQFSTFVIGCGRRRVWGVLPEIGIMAAPVNTTPHPIRKGILYGFFHTLTAWLKNDRIGILTIHKGTTFLVSFDVL